MPGVLAELAEGVAECEAQAAGQRRGQVGDETSTGPADLLDGEHDPGLGVVVVVADGDRPRHPLELPVLARGQVVGGCRVVVDRAPHATILAGMCAAAPTPPFLAACRGEPHDTVPVWFMRQAGRSLPEYRAIRGRGSILDAIRQPDLAAEITLQPVRRYGVDAAILYSDIVVPAAAVGFGVDVAPGTGPVVAEPFASAADLDRLRPLEPETDTPYVLETVRILAAELPDDVPVIGFAGGPFTVASYLVEGRPSRTYARTKALMLGEPALFGALLDRLAHLAADSIASQVAAGARRLPAVRLVGGRADPGAVRAARASPQPNRLRAPRLPRRARDPFRRQHRRAARPARRGRGRRRRRRLAHAPCRSPGSGSGPGGPCRATSIPPCASARGRRSRPRSAASSPRTAAIPATSSTSVTACCPRPTRRSSSGSSSSSTPRGRSAPRD